ncbi:MAG: biotin/lipoyl-containing protein, partial [Streptosporangiaceae bacterium]
MSVSVSMPQLGESVTEGTVTRWLKREGEHVNADEPLLEVSTDKVDTEIPSPVSGVLRGITVAEDETVAVGAQLAVIDEEGSSGATAAAPASARAAAPEPAPAPEQAPPPGPERVQQTQTWLTPEPEYQPQSGYQQQAGYQPQSGYQPEPSYQQPGTDPYQAETPSYPPAPAPSASVPDEAGSSAPGAEADEARGYANGAESPYVTPLVRKLATENGIDLAAVTGTGVGGRIRKQDVLAFAEKQAEAKKAPTAPAAKP